MSSTSKQGPPKLLLTRDECIRAQGLLKALSRQPGAHWFRLPVDFVGLGLTDYPEIIKEPMDLSTVRKRLVNNEYQNLDEFIFDVQLIWDNCKTYNPAGSVVAEEASKCEQFMHDYCTEHNIPQPSPIRRPREPVIPVEEKTELSELVKKVSHDALAHIVTIVENECPQAYTQLDKERVMISLDMINKATFDKLKEVIHTDVGMPNKKQKIEE
ncbi:unnamed protein product [Blepharisma stoltei]|uniref:Bromo domain-containing protein n=1 Tax=Blepharisma stoltei TaxID=1481888 RepID=A0AAU9IDU2_9CILI|nr:unnamed protein product [Blepharisma stoltei]